MRKWNATMPLKRAEPGAANVVLAFKNAAGDRMELEATMSAEDARNLMNQAIEMMKAHKAQKAAA